MAQGENHMTKTTTITSPVAALLLLGMIAGCSKQPETPAPGAAAPAPGTTPAAPATAPAQPAVAAQVQAMGAEQLREAASKALSENRIYAPGGNNAVEYYLALRDKLANDPAVASALTDLMPYTVIAAEQSIGREDFTEAQRLAALIEKADPKAPALPRLKASIASAQQAAAQRVVTEEAKAKADAEAKQKEQQRLAQQAEQQKQAADALATQQAAAQREQAARAAAEAQRPAAPPAATAQTPAPARETPAPASSAPAPAAAAAAQNVTAISTPAPRYPPEALRSGTSGEVLVEITIGPDGEVSNARVVRANPARVFDREALNAVRRWKFQPVGSTVTIRRTIAFNPS